MLKDLKGQELRTVRSQEANCGIRAFNQLVSSRSEVTKLEICTLHGATSSWNLSPAFYRLI